MIRSHAPLGGIRMLVVAALMTFGMVAVAPYPSARADTQTFEYTGDVQTYTVPAASLSSR